MDIDYKKISDALEFYQNKGFKLKEVPWIVSNKTYNITNPLDYDAFHTSLGEVVASGEQSFLELIRNGELKEGKYICSTPCFRDDPIDETHHKWFMKVELIDFLGKDLPSSKELKQKRDFILNSSMEFFERYLKTSLEKTDQGIDIVSSKEKIELGSYGIRNYNNEFSWIYGTGVAEPRLSYCLRNEKGYHLTDIPRGKFGELSKIVEEVEEMMDASKQGNKIMLLTELSDMIGSIEAYLEKEYQGKITIKDLFSMKKATRRAFVNKKR